MFYDKIRDFLFRDHFPVYPYPFPEIPEMRRSIKADLIPCLLQNGSNHMRNRTLSVCACYMNSPESRMRVTKVRIKRIRIIKIIFIGSFSYSMICRELAEQKIECLLVSHIFVLRSITIC